MCAYTYTHISEHPNKMMHSTEQTLGGARKRSLPDILVLIVADFAAEVGLGVQRCPLGIPPSLQTLQMQQPRMDFTVRTSIW